VMMVVEPKCTLLYSIEDIYLWFGSDKIYVCGLVEIVFIFNCLPEII